MAEGRVGAIGQQSIEAIVLLDSDETKLIFRPQDLSSYTLALLPKKTSLSPLTYE
jgi:hypothetical protein